MELDRFVIVGNYLRFDEATRSSLKDFRQQIVGAFQRHSVEPRNFLVWGAPGSGKSYLVQQIAAQLFDTVQYREINLAQEDESSFRAALHGLAELTAPALCLIDEADAKPAESWPYELLLPLLEPPRPRSHPSVFVLAGSGGRELAEMKERIRGRPKGTDLLSRIPAGNEFVVPSLGAGDRMIVATVQLLLAAATEGRAVREIEKLALYYIAVNSAFGSARQLRGLASQAAERVPPGDDRIRYDNLFGAGAAENKEFWAATNAVREGLANSFVHVVPRGRVEPALSSLVSTPTPTAPERASPSTPTTRIAVLPFANMSPDPNDEFFADGLTEELITRLYEVKGLEVIARTSVMSYKKRETNIIGIGKELRVGTLIEGSVRKSGNRIRVTAQVINGATGAHLWASTYDRTLDDMFAIQTEIAVKIAQSTGVALQGTPEHATASPNPEFETYSDYLRANQLLRSGRTDSFEEARLLFERALARNPTFPRPHVGLGWVAWTMANSGREPFAEGIRVAKQEVAKALQLDPGLAEGYDLLARILWAGEDAGSAAERAAKRALEINPNLPESYTTLGWIAGAQGNPEESLRLMEKAYLLDPVSPTALTGVGVALLHAGKGNELIEFWNRHRHLNPYRASVDMVELYIGRGETNKAGEALAEALRLRPNSHWVKMLQAYLLATQGDREAALRALSVLEQSFPEWGGLSAYVLCALGDLDGFFQKVGEGLANHSLHIDKFLYSPLCASARSDPRYDALVRRMRLAWFGSESDAPVERLANPAATRAEVGPDPSPRP